uniref:helix-turn-helix transcriptional regulator n=1 Tax=Sphingomonas sp. GlSt437 TaxID=3389970 RepID=UPI003A83C62A
MPAQSEPVFQTTHGPYLRALKSLTEARIASRQAKYHLCGRLANAALDHARRSQSSRLEISALLCLAGANAATERSAAAEQRVADAVDIAARSGCYRTLLDERQYLEVLGPVSLPLLDLMPDEREFGGRGIAPGDRPSYAPIATDTVLLTRKELAILHRIKEGLSNRDIAAGTALAKIPSKWHVHNIFSKVGSQKPCPSDFEG